MSRTLPRRADTPFRSTTLGRSWRALRTRLRNRRFQFILLTDVSKPPRKLSITAGMALVLSALLGSLALFAGAVAYEGFAHSLALHLAQRRIAELGAERDDLAGSNRRQSAALVDLGRQVEQLADRLRELERSAQSIGRKVGVTIGGDASTAAAATGAPASAGLPAASADLPTASAERAAPIGPLTAPDESDVDPVGWVEGLLGRTAQQDQQLTTVLDRLASPADAYAARLAHTPAGLPVAGAITSPFGVRTNPIERSREMHQGVDIAAQLGEPVQATADGRVRYAGWIPGYGNAVEIDHGYGYLTLYGHNSRLAVKAGQTVVRGAVIAYAGSTGLSTGPHVHYEIRVAGRAVDPLAFARKSER
ncbi:MAG TPA: M23 family metallopeptidase [Limnochordia bacterium]|nr:M23 family metallopeptidase [Limnochordia bacterium]